MFPRFPFSCFPVPQGFSVMGQVEKGLSVESAYHLQGGFYGNRWFIGRCLLLPHRGLFMQSGHVFHEGVHGEGCPATPVGAGSGPDPQPVVAGLLQSYRGSCCGTVAGETHPGMDSAEAVACLELYLNLYLLFTCVAGPHLYLNILSGKEKFLSVAWLLNSRWRNMYLLCGYGWRGGCPVDSIFLPLPCQGGGSDRVVHHCQGTPPGPGRLVICPEPELVSAWFFQGKAQSGHPVCSAKSVFWMLDRLIGCIGSQSIAQLKGNPAKRGIFDCDLYWCPWPEAVGMWHDDKVFWNIARLFARWFRLWIDALLRYVISWFGLFELSR